MTFNEIRNEFFERYGYKRKYKGKRPFTQNEYNADTRCAFCDYVEYLRRDEIITESQAHRITLK